MANKTFRILSIDGGGIRGVFPAHMLYCVKHRLGINIEEHFDMIAGTSTGSIVAAAVACKIDPAKVVAMYKEHGPKIFSRKKSWLPQKFAKYQPALENLYENEALKTALVETFGEVRLGEIPIPLLMPATDIGNGGVHVFKSAYQKTTTETVTFCCTRRYWLPVLHRHTSTRPRSTNTYLLTADSGPTTPHLPQ